MTLAGLFRRKPKPKKEQDDMDKVLQAVRTHAADLRRNSSEINQWLTSLEGHNHHG
ncbi:MAG: hypothetical protein WKF86_00205 [Acidimicrobiales bacterium]